MLLFFKFVAVVSAMQAFLQIKVTHTPQLDLISNLVTDTYSEPCQTSDGAFCENS